MEKDQFGLPRPLVNDGEGPAGFDRPLVGSRQETLIAELESAVGDEEQADIDYHRIIMMLREQGFNSEADTVEQIREEEMKHRDMFKNVLSNVRRKTSF